MEKLEIFEDQSGNIVGLAPENVDTPSGMGRRFWSKVDKRPTLPDLRESGNIEQDAYAIIFLYRDDYYRAKGEQKFMPTGDVELIVAKNRNGPFGTARCSFEERTTRFFQAPTREELLQADFDEMDWRNQ